MRISDWSSDVCSSDLKHIPGRCLWPGSGSWAGRCVAVGPGVFPPRAAVIHLKADAPAWEAGRCARPAFPRGRRDRLLARGKHVAYDAPMTDTLARLHATILSRPGADASTSSPATLFARERARLAHKHGPWAENPGPA